MKFPAKSMYNGSAQSSDEPDFTRCFRKSSFCRKFGESQNGLAIIYGFGVARHFNIEEVVLEWKEKWPNFATATQSLERARSAQRCSAKLAQQFSIYHHIPLYAVGSPEVAVQPATRYGASHASTRAFCCPTIWATWRC